MEISALAFYAIVCGTLSAVSPVFLSLPIRMATGAAVGVAAAATLPSLQGMIGY